MNHLELKEDGDPVPCLWVDHLSCVVEHPASDAEPVLAPILGLEKKDINDDIDNNDEGDVSRDHLSKQPADHCAQGHHRLHLPAQLLGDPADGGVGPPVLGHDIAVEVLSYDTHPIQLSIHSKSNVHLAGRQLVSMLRKGQQDRRFLPL